MQVNIENLEEELARFYSAKDFETMAQTIRHLFRMLRQDQRMFGMALYEPVSDRYLYRIAHLLHRRQSAVLNANTVMHVISQVYTTGGHTRVFEDIVSAMPEKKHVLIMTNATEHYTGYLRLPDLLEERFRKLGVEVIFLQKGGLLDRIYELLDHVDHFAPQTIFLNAHHEDVIAYGAICGDTAPRVHFLHHADHHPSLGATRPDYEHVDLTAECHRFCCTHVVPAPSMLNMTVTDKGAIYAVPQGPITGATSGAHHKFHGKLLFSYPELLAAMFKSGLEKFYHIGDLSATEIEHIRKEVVLNGADPDRIVFTGNVPSLADFLKELTPHFYMESHPVGGGKARIEVMSLRLPVLRAEPDEKIPLFRWVDNKIGSAVLITTLDEVAAKLQELLQNRERIADENRLFYEENHRPERFRDTLLAMTEILPEGARPPVPDDYKDAGDLTLMSTHEIRALDTELDRRAGTGHPASILKPEVQSPAGTAVSGHEGYLFIGNGTNRWEEQFLGTLDPGVDWLGAWSELLDRRQSMAQAAGVSLWNLVIPEKQSVLTRKRWPDFPDAEIARPILKLLDKVEIDKHLMYPDRTLLTATASSPVFFRHNSHWTASGCLAVIRLLMMAFSSTVDVDTLKFKVERRTLAHDLTVHFFDPAPEEEVVNLAACGKVVADNRMYQLQGRHTGSSYKLENLSAPEKRSVMIFGDSYSYDAGLSYALSAIFSTVSFIWSKDILWSEVTAQKPDIVLWESAERYILTVPTD